MLNLAEPEGEDIMYGTISKVKVKAEGWDELQQLARR